jgi:hypothetical protein
MSAKDLWGWAAVLAAILLLVDVAWRRIAFDSRDARELAQRMTGGAVAVGTGGVDALRRARSGAGVTGPGGAGVNVGAPQGTAAGARDGATATAARKFEAAQGGKVDAVRDLGIHGDAGTSGETDQAGGPAAPPEDALARLRAARKRAQDRTDSGSDEGGNA